MKHKEKKRICKNKRSEIKEYSSEEGDRKDKNSHEINKIYKFPFNENNNFKDLDACLNIMFHNNKDFQERYVYLHAL